MADKNKEEILGNKATTDGLSKSNPIGQHPALLFFVFLLLINKFSRRGGALREISYGSGDEFVVDMDKNPAFPLEKSENKQNRRKKSILNIHDPQDFLGMVERIKPYMDAKNQYILTIFDRWRGLLRDMNSLSDFDSPSNIQDSSSKNPGDILNLLEDLSPFIHQDYHSEVQQISKGIKNMMEIQTNIHNLQNTFTHINGIQDNAQKINHLIDAIEPFMPKEKASTLSQFKNLSRMMDVMKMADVVSKSTDQSSQTTEGNKGEGQDKESNFMELLDILDSPPHPDQVPAPATIDPPAPEHIENPIEDREQPPQEASSEDIEDRDTMAEFVDAIEGEDISQDQS